jgi:2-oxoglutarate ferredoxin oxidoreductase subunit alpha
MSTDVQIAIIGSAGDGTIAAGDILRRAMAEIGYRVISFDLYPAEIRGFGKCIARLRVTDEQAYSLKQKSDILVSLDDSHAIPHVGEAREWGAVIYENNSVNPLPEGAHLSAHIDPGQIPYNVAIRELAEKSTGSARSRNIVIVGYIIGLMHLPIEPVLRALVGKFKGKGEIAQKNEAALRAGYEEGLRSFRLDDIAFGPPPTCEKGAHLEMVSGNAAIVRGALDAGIDTFFGYPITPATSIMERLASEMPKRGARLVQTEDEIAAISATIGAGYTGARSATATSGPGLSLMAEMLGFGVIAEVPCVVFVSQRGGPSTGMPTKHEQSDLNMAVYGGHGDSPRIVIAPTNVDGCYRCAGKAFELAEAYQTPVIVLLDLYLSNRYETVPFPDYPPFDPDMVRHADTRGEAGGGFKRYALTPDGISPRSIPGQPGGMYVATGLEHNELGRPNDQPDVHLAQSRKRHEKLKLALQHPDFVCTKRFGNAGTLDVGLVSWGSTFGECLEAMLLAQAEGIRCGALKVVMIAPFPVDAVSAFLDDCTEVLVPEVNYEGQFAGILQSNLPQVVTRLSRIPCEPMRVEDILGEIRRLAGRTAEPKAA